MVDLGKYTSTVLSAYAISLALLAVIILLSLWQSRRMKTRLDAAETRRMETSKNG